MNSVNLIGRLTRDPEERWTGEMCVASFSVAIDRPPRKDGSKETDYPRVKVFGRQAENCVAFLRQGKMVGITGRIQTGKYTNNEGQTIYTTEVVADRVEFLSPKDSDHNPQNYGYNPQGFGA